MLEFRSELDDYIGKIKESDLYKDFIQRELPHKIDRERKAFEVIKNNRGNYTLEVLNEFIDLADVSEQGKKLWFGPLLIGVNKNALIGASGAKLNEWIEALLFSDLKYEDAILYCNKEIKIYHVGFGFITLLLYLSNPLKYNVWVNATETGLKKISNGEFPRGIKGAKKYTFFNDAVNSFRDKYNFKPQEIDWLLAYATTKFNFGDAVDSSDLFDKNVLIELISKYKDLIKDEEYKELYKWNTVKTFQDNWDIDKENFKDMLNKCLQPENNNLWVGANYFPRAMLIAFCESHLSQVRQMFTTLFDESISLLERISHFRTESQNIIEQYPDKWNHHYQDERAIMLYLTLRYPETYYFYKYKMFKDFSAKIGTSIAPKKGKKKNPVEFLKLCNLIKSELEKDQEFIQLHHDRLPQSTYQDLANNLLTQDFVYCSTTYLSKTKIYPIKDEDNITTDNEIEEYTKQDALKDLFLSSDEFQNILDILKHKNNIILQGSPGVGKTFIAKRIAYSKIGKKDESKVEMIQFHQSYSYEDFIQGFRPTEDGKFDLVNGIFYEFCRKAQRDGGNDYVFIIDEINRGNLSKIFGELMMLIEADKRGEEFALPLTYSKTNDAKFYIPENVYIIGTMNTADRSLAMVDYALRRRFSFISLEPCFDNFLKDYLKTSGVNAEVIDKITVRMKRLNDVVANDKKNLGEGFKIGHSYFCTYKDKLDAEVWYKRVIKTEIEPLLREYWFDNEDEAEKRIKELLA